MLAKQGTVYACVLCPVCSQGESFLIPPGAHKAPVAGIMFALLRGTYELAARPHRSQSNMCVESRRYLIATRMLRLRDLRDIV